MSDGVAAALGGHGGGDGGGVGGREGGGEGERSAAPLAGAMAPFGSWLLTTDCAPTTELRTNSVL